MDDVITSLLTSKLSPRQGWDTTDPRHHALQLLKDLVRRCVCVYGQDGGVMMSMMREGVTVN